MAQHGTVVHKNTAVRYDSTDLSATPCTTLIALTEYGKFMIVNVEIYGLNKLQLRTVHVMLRKNYFHQTVNSSCINVANAAHKFVRIVYMNYRLCCFKLYCSGIHNAGLREKRIVFPDIGLHGSTLVWASNVVSIMR